MRSVLKACDLEDRFPILAVENNCIVSKDADITVAFEVELPELYTVTAAEYEAIHGTWVKAMKVLPNYSVVYKQDWFVKENYRSEGNGTESFLSRSYERHFNERPYLRHRWQWEGGPRISAGGWASTTFRLSWTPDPASSPQAGQWPAPPAPAYIPPVPPAHSSGERPCPW